LCIERATARVIGVGCLVCIALVETVAAVASAPRVSHEQEVADQEMLRRRNRGRKVLLLFTQKNALQRVHPMKIRSLLVAALVSAMSLVSFAAAPQSGESSGSATTAISPAALGTLTYSAFTGGTCSTTGFSVNTTSTVSFAGPTVQVNGGTTLNGTAYDTFAFTLGSPQTFGTGFGRTFTVAQPTNTYTFVFNSAVTFLGLLQGTSVTTMTCAAGVLNTTNVWVAAPTPVVPTTSQAVLLALGLLLAAAAVWRMRRA